MRERVPRAPRAMPLDAQRAYLAIDRRHWQLLWVLSAGALATSLLLASAGLPGFWVRLSRATTEGTVGAVERHERSLTIPYEYSAGGSYYRGTVDAPIHDDLSRLTAGDTVVVEYCSFWAKQSQIEGTSGVSIFTLTIAALLLATLVPLGWLLIGKERRMARCVRTYRDGEPVEGTIIELARRRTSLSGGTSATWAELRYRYRPAAVTAGLAEELEGSVTALRVRDSKHLDRDSITILCLRDAPHQSVPFWKPPRRTS